MSHPVYHPKPKVIDVPNLSCYVAGKPIDSINRLDVISPYDGRLVGTIGLATSADTNAAIECLKDDGQIFSCDISPTGKARKIFTLREPLSLAVAITPFNHPLNQVV